MGCWMERLGGLLRLIWKDRGVRVMVAIEN